MNWIQQYEVEKVCEITSVRGTFPASSGIFEIEYSGDGGNADTFIVTLSGGQYDSAHGRPLTFTITGAWEIREVIEMFGLLGTIVDRK